MSSDPAADCTLQMYQSYLDQATPYLTYRWAGTAVALMLFFVRIVIAEGWYIGEQLRNSLRDLR